MSVFGRQIFPALWLTGDHTVGKMFAISQSTKQTQPFIPPGSVNVSTWISEVETFDNDRP